MLSWINSHSNGKDIEIKSWISKKNTTKEHEVFLTIGYDVTICLTLEETQRVVDELTMSMIALDEEDAKLP